MRRYFEIYSIMLRNSLIREMSFKANFILWLIVEVLWFLGQIFSLASFSARWIASAIGQSGRWCCSSELIRSSRRFFRVFSSSTFPISRNWFGPENSTHCSSYRSTANFRFRVNSSVSIASLTRRSAQSSSPSSLSRLGIVQVRAPFCFT